MIRVVALLAAFIALLIAQPLRAGEQPGPVTLEQRAEQLIPILEGKGGEEAYFSQTFLAQIPASRIRAIAEQLASQYGKIRKVTSVRNIDAQSGAVELDYEKADITVNLTLDPRAPNQVIGLLIAAMKQRGDTSEKIAADVARLPGRAAILVRRLDVAEAPTITVRSTEALAVGSSFKLWLLAELSRSVRAGERKWTDVTTIDTPSLPSGITQRWPRSSPLTLHSLATLMISISDNTATDTLLRTLGREKVDGMVAIAGHSAPASTTPVLATTEAFALKMNANVDLRARWTTANVDARRKLLKEQAARLTPAAIVAAELGAEPRSIDTVEWFASPADMAATLDWFRKANDPTALEILAVNPGLSSAATERFAYVGFKGGSETGVLALNYLIRTKSGAWYAVAASWNNPVAGVDNPTLMALVERAVALIQ